MIVKKARNGNRLVGKAGLLALCQLGNNQSLLSCLGAFLNFEVSIIISKVDTKLGEYVQYKFYTTNIGLKASHVIFDIHLSKLVFT